jgi:deoxyadenosine/deoxycytidine kinase
MNKYNDESIYPCLDNNKHKLFLEIINGKYGKKQFYTVDAIIGAGKTTLIKRIVEINNKMWEKQQAQNIDFEDDESDTCIEEIPKICAVYEPVELWREDKALQLFYENVDQHCLEFQMYACNTRVNSLIDTVIANPDADIYLLERSIWTDKHIFVEMLKPILGETRTKMYNRNFDLISMLIPIKIRGWIFLDLNMNEVFNRLHNRHRDEEMTITREYQENLQEQHNKFKQLLYKEEKNVKLITNDLMKLDFKSNDSDLMKIMNEIYFRKVK